MNIKNHNGPAAVIEVGSSAVRMRISQMRRGVIETLDSLEYPVSLGHEILATDFHPKTKAFSVREVRLIAYYLGKPGEFKLC